MENETIVGKEPVQKKLRKAFLLPSLSVLDALKIHALKKHMRYEEFYYYLIREGYKALYSKYPEEDNP